MIDTRPEDPFSLPAPGLFWQSKHPAITAMHWEARRRIASLWGVALATILRSLLTIPPHVRYRSTLKPEGSPLNMVCGFVGSSGTGKGSVFAASEAAVIFEGFEFPAASTARSGQALAALLGAPAERKKGDEGYETGEPRWHRKDHAAHVHFDEVSDFAARGAGEGSTLFASVTAASSGEQLGGQNSKGDGLTIPAGEYRMVISVSVQPKLAAALLTEARIASGFAGRLVWGAVEDPEAATAARITEPVEPHRLTLGHWEGVTFIDALPEMEAAHETDARNAQAGKRAAVDSRLLLNRAMVAIALANLAGRSYLVPEDWELAGAFMAHSREVLAGIFDELEAPAADRRTGVETRLRERMGVLKAQGESFPDARRRLSNAQGRMLTELLEEGKFDKW